MAPTFPNTNLVPTPMFDRSSMFAQITLPVIALSKARSTTGRYDRAPPPAGYNADLIQAGFDSSSPSRSRSGGSLESSGGGDGGGGGTPVPSDSGGGSPGDSDAESVPTPTFPTSPGAFSLASPAVSMAATGVPFTMTEASPLQTVMETENGEEGGGRPTFGRRLRDMLSPSNRRCVTFFGFAIKASSRLQLKTRSLYSRTFSNIHV